MIDQSANGRALECRDMDKKPMKTMTTVQRRYDDNRITNRTQSEMRTAHEKLARIHGEAKKLFEHLAKKEDESDFTKAEEQALMKHREKVDLKLSNSASEQNNCLNGQRINCNLAKCTSILASIYTGYHAC